MLQIKHLRTFVRSLRKYGYAFPTFPNLFTVPFSALFAITFIPVSVPFIPSPRPNLTTPFCFYNLCTNSRSFVPLLVYILFFVNIHRFVKYGESDLAVKNVQRKAKFYYLSASLFKFIVYWNLYVALEFFSGHLNLFRISEKFRMHRDRSI